MKKTLLEWQHIAPKHVSTSLHYWFPRQVGHAIGTNTPTYRHRCWLLSLARPFPLQLLTFIQNSFCRSHLRIFTILIRALCPGAGFILGGSGSALAVCPFQEGIPNIPNWSRCPWDRHCAVTSLWPVGAESKIPEVKNRPVPNTVLKLPWHWNEQT